MSDQLYFGKVVFIGFGLIGASMAAAMKQAQICGEITAVLRTQKSCDTALRLKLCDSATLDPRTAVKGADLVVLALPVASTETVLKTLRGYLKTGVILTDVGSTKVSVIEAAKAALSDLPAGFVPGHPIAGSEQSGPSAADKDLYRGKSVILTPLESTGAHELDLVTRLWEACGAIVTHMQPERHDQVLAATSHLPHLLAFNLVEQLASSNDNLEHFRFAAGGFRDFTRIAASDPVMWRDIFFSNKPALLDAISDFEQHLERLKLAIVKSDSDSVLGVFTRARAARRHFDHMLKQNAYTQQLRDNPMSQEFVCAPAGSGGAQVSGVIKVPGDKSISHRSIMFGSLATGTTKVSGFLEGEDALATLQAFRDLGVTIVGPDQGEVVIHGVGLHGLKAPGGELYMGNSGTSMRLLSGIMAAQSFDTVLTGDVSLSKRPMERVAKPLRTMGAKLQTTGERGTAPISITAVKNLTGAHYEMPVASAQVKSCALLAGLFAQGKTSVTEPEVTRDHTERMLRGFGVEVISEKLGEHATKVTITPPDQLIACDIAVPSDISSATFFMVAAAIADSGSITLEAVGMNPTRTGVIDILRLMGAKLELSHEREEGGEPVADVTVHASNLTNIDIPEHLVPLAIDEFPAIFIAASCAEGTMRLTGAAELRVKESDRIQVMADGLTTLGVDCTVLGDGLTIQGRGGEQAVFGGGRIESHHDHRIAMSFAVASLRSTEAIVIEGTETVATSFPNFVELANQVGLQITAREV